MKTQRGETIIKKGATKDPKEIDKCETKRSHHDKTKQEERKTRQRLMIRSGRLGKGRDMESCKEDTWETPEENIKK